MNNLRLFYLKGVTLFRNYVKSAQAIEIRKPNFSRNVSNDLAHSVENMLHVNRNSADIQIMHKISQAPESIFKPLISIITQPDKPATLEQIRAFRRNLYNICKKNPEAKEYIKSLQTFLAENKNVSSLINRIGKGVSSYMNVFLNSTHFNKGVANAQRNNYKHSTIKIMERLNQENLNTHLQNFFKYI